MNMMEYAMVNELASLVEDNFSCKHLLISMEAAFVRFLQDDRCSLGILELEPMNPYNRLLLHRLADIFGFDHKSVGEGDSRHLVLERSPDTSIPSILLSDILCHCDESQLVTRSTQLLKGQECPSDLMMKSLSAEYTLEEKAATDISSGKQIFSVRVEDIQQPLKQRPQFSPLVAQRIIAHALGSNSRDRKPHQVKDINSHGEVVGDVVGDDVVMCSPSKSCQENTVSMDSTDDSRGQKQKQAKNDSTGVSLSTSGRSLNSEKKGNLKEEQLGAAKRMFAHAMRQQPTNNGMRSQCSAKDCK